MAITIGVGPTDATDNTGSGSATVVLNGVTAGRSLLVCIRWFHATFTVTSVSCTGESNLALQTPSGPDAGGRNAQWAVLDNVTAGGNKTITATFSGGTFHAGVMAVEVIGGNTADIFDAVGNASGSSANPTANVTTAANNEAVFSACFTSNANEVVEGAGFTAVPLGQTTGAAHGEYDLDVGAAGVIAAGFTDSSGTGDWVVSAIALNNHPPSSAVTVSGDGSTASTGEKSGLGADALSGGGSVITVGPPALSGDSVVSGDGAVVTLGQWGAVGASVVTGDGAITTSGYQSYLWSESATLPMWSEDSAFLSEVVWRESATMSMLTEVSVLLPGSLFAELGTLPMWVELSVLAASPFSESATIPMWIEQSRFESAITAAFRGWPINLKNFALTEYDAMPFNSFCRLNNEYLAAGDSGIFALSGSDDNGVNIDARVRLALSDLGIQQLKRLEAAFISYRSAGTLVLRIVVDGGDTYEYPLEPTGKTGMYQVRVKTGKGLKTNYVCLEIANSDGCDFDLDQIRINPAILSRSIGGD